MTVSGAVYLGGGRQWLIDCSSLHPFSMLTHPHTLTQTCKHRQTGSSHCSSFVYTLFPTGDPIVPFVISPRFECLNKRTHTVHMALMGYFIVFSFVTKPGQTLEFLLWGTIVPLNFLAGYYCCKYPTTYGVRVHPTKQVVNYTKLVVLARFSNPDAAAKQNSVPNCPSTLFRIKSNP